MSINKRQAHEQRDKLLWNKRDQKLLETLQNCRKRLIESQAGAGQDELKRIPALERKDGGRTGNIRKDHNSKGGFGSCPQFTVVSDSDDNVTKWNIQNTKRKKKLKSMKFVPGNQVFSPRIGNFFSSLRERNMNASQTFSLNFPIESDDRTLTNFGVKSLKVEPISRQATLHQIAESGVKSLKVEPIPRQTTLLKIAESGVKSLKVKPVFKQGTLHQTAEQKKSQEDNVEARSPTPPPAPVSVNIVIPTGGVLMDSSSVSSKSSCITNAKLKKDEFLEQQRKPKKKIVKVTTSITDVSPSVSATTHILITKKISKKTYDFPEVSPLSGSRTSNNSHIDSDKVSLPNIPQDRRHNSVLLGYCTPNSDKACESPTISNSRSSGKYRFDQIPVVSIGMPPCASNAPTPDSGRRYVQTSDGVFILNITKTSPPFSDSTMLPPGTPEISMPRTHYPNKIGNDMIES